MGDTKQRQWQGDGKQWKGDAKQRDCETITRANAIKVWNNESIKVKKQKSAKLRKDENKEGTQ